MVEKYIESIIQQLFLNHIVTSFNILKRESGDEEGFVRIKCCLLNDDILEFAEFFKIKKNKIIIEMYSYHWQTSNGRLIKRWDNVAHHKEIKTFPNHLHLQNGTVTSSLPMTLNRVLSIIADSIPSENDNV